jgi:hypothetical protein
MDLVEALGAEDGAVMLSLLDDQIVDESSCRSSEEAVTLESDTLGE